MGLSEPIIKRLRKKFDVQSINLFPQNFGASYLKMIGYCDGSIGKPDLVFCTGDRVEMTAAACAAFHNGVKIAHYYGGVINNPPTALDDWDRHVITLWSDIQFCESETAVGHVWDLRYAAGLRCNNIYEVGISHLDDLEIDESKVPHTCFPECRDLPYDLILINYTGEEFNVPRFGNMTIQIGSNPDGEIHLPVFDINDTFYQNLPRAQFLGLLKNCEHFITNSSCAYYEAPYFLKPDQIVMVGKRNKNRLDPTGIEFKPGASDKIVEILEEYLA
jgi:UDP-N-acetylglucosamine 2-epimerase